MASSFEQLVFEIIATDRNASAAFDRFRQQVDKTSRSVDDNTTKMDKNSESIDKAGKSAQKATPLFGALGGMSGMGALIGAGVALSPVIATVGTGLAGFGLAAYGSVAPVLKAAQASGGLAANLGKLDPEQKKVAQGLLGLQQQYKIFQAALEPDVMGVFNKALQLAGTLMSDVQPVAAATGKALGVLLDRVDAEFRSGEWQQFFSWMAANVGPDFQQIGNLAIDLMKTLPTVLEDLQPIAKAFLQVTDAAVKAGDAYAKFIQTEAHKAHGQGTIFTQIRDFLKYGFGGHHAADQAAAGIKKVGDNAQTAAGQIESMASEVKTLSTNEANALDTQLKYSNSLITAANDAATLKQNLKLSHDWIGLHTQAQRNSFQTANTYISDLSNEAQQALASGKGAATAAADIRRGLPILDSAKSKSRLYWQEVQTLKHWLDLLSQVPMIREKILVTGRGQWSTTAALHAIAQGPGPFSAGGRVPGSGNADSYLGLLTPGEVVVPKRMVAAGAVDHLRGALPGFAAGGIIPSYGDGVPGLQPWGRHNLNASTWQIVGGIGAAMARAFMNAVQSMAAAGGGFAGPGGGQPAANAALARRLFPMWATGANWAAWNYVAMRESGWSQYARNPTSGAYGIAQALPPTKYPFAGQAAGGSNPTAQITWMAQYMAGVYGGPIGAAAHERAFNWYDQGGWLPPGLSVSYNGTGRPERVGGPQVINIHVSVPPTVNPRQAGQQIAELILAHTKAGGTLYPQGVRAR